MPGLRTGLGAVLRGSTVVLVALAWPGGAGVSPEPLGRWRIELGADHPYADAAQRSPRDAPRLVADAQDAAEAAMSAGLRTLLSGLEPRPVGLALMAASAPQQEEVGQVVVSQRRTRDAEAAFHRDAALAGAMLAGLDVRLVEQVPEEPPGLGHWTADERLAAAAALVVLAP